MIDKLKKNYFLLISTFLLLYFFFNLFDGERGLISFFDKKSQLQDLVTENLDLDYVETLIREKFLFGKEGETIYIIKDNEN